jgi:hypothetical protein
MLRWRALGVILLAAWLGGCGGGGESDALLIDYQRHLAESLDQPAPEPQAARNIGAFPDRRERLLTVAETREGMLAVYALRDCHITHLVAERNNQLGRVAPASQRWLYELELWRRMVTCWQSGVSEALADADRERLVRLIDIKTGQLPAVSWNALFDSSEWAASFSRASSPLPSEETRPHDDQIAALNYLRHVTLHQFDLGWRPESSLLEGHLKTLQTRPFSAEVLRTLMLAEQRLKEASDLLDTALAQSGICSRLNQAPWEMLRSAESERVDEWRTRLRDVARVWLESIDALLEAQIEGPPAAREYRRQWLSLTTPGAPFQAFESAMKRHDTLREMLVDKCR